MPQTEQFYSALKLLKVPTAMVRFNDEWHGTTSQAVELHAHAALSALLVRQAQAVAGDDNDVAAISRRTDNTKARFTAGLRYHHSAATTSRSPATSARPRAAARRRNPPETPAASARGSAGRR